MSPLSLRRAGDCSASGVEARDADEREVVSVGEVPERLVRGHDHAPLARGEPGGESGVERGEVGRQGGGVRGVGVSVVGVGLGERGGDRVGKGHQALRVEPEVGVGGVALLAYMAGDQVDGVGGVDDVRRFAGSDGGVDRALEPGQVDHQVGLADGPDLARRELDIVRFGAGRRQRADRDEVAAHLLGDVLQRVEGGEDLDLAGTVGAARGVRPRGARRQQEAGGGEGR